MFKKYIFYSLATVLCFSVKAQDWSLKLSSNVEIRSWKLSSTYEKEEKSLQGASIVLTRAGETISQTTSDGNGDFTVMVPPNGEYVLTVSYPGYNTKRFAVNTKNVPPEFAKDNYKPTFSIGGFIMAKPFQGIDYSGLSQPLVMVQFLSKKKVFDHDDAVTENGLSIVTKIAEAEMALIQKFCGKNKLGDVALVKPDCPLAKTYYQEAMALIAFERYPIDQLAKVGECLRFKNEQEAKAAAEKAAAEAAAKAKAEADAAAKAKADADATAKAKADAESAAANKAKAQAEASAKAQADADAKAKAEADRLAKQKEGLAKSKAEDEAAAKAAEDKRKEKEAKRLEEEAKAKADAEATAKAEAEKKKEKEQKQKEGLAKAKADDQAEAKAAEEKRKEKEREKEQKQKEGLAKAKADDEAEAKVIADKKRADDEAKRLKYETKSTDVTGEQDKRDTKKSIPQVLGGVDKYKENIKKADDYFKMKRWSEAKPAYEEALKYRADDAYAKSKLEIVEKNLATPK